MESVIRPNKMFFASDELRQQLSIGSGVSRATSVLLCLLVVDLAFVFLHFLSLTDLINDTLFSLERDRAYPERFQYVKILSIVILMLLVRKRADMIGFSGWSLLFLYLLIDDAFRLHETLGGYVATGLALSPAIGLRAKDFGELIVSMSAGIFFLGLIAVSYLRGSGAFRQASNHLFLLVLALAFFGVFVDMLHVAIDMGWKVSFVLGAVEDGGEMIIMTIIAWYALLISGRAGSLRGSLQPAL